MLTIRPMLVQDVATVAKIHGDVFIRQFSSKKWITCNFNAYPKVMMYVAVEDNNQVIGYVSWLQKSGFRKSTVIELEQIAILPTHQGKHIGSELITKSLALIKEYLASQHVTLKAALVTTRTDNMKAQKLYENTLNAKVVTVLEDLYSHDEVIMIGKYLQ